MAIQQRLARENRRYRKELRDRYGVVIAGGQGKWAGRILRIPDDEMKKAVALIAGRAFVGYRSFNALDPNVPDYKGLVASVDAIYTVAVTRVAVTSPAGLTVSAGGSIVAPAGLALDTLGTPATTGGTICCSL